MSDKLARPWVLAGLAALLIAAGIAVLWNSERMQSKPPTAAAGNSPELDYGFVELDHGGLAVPVASYKHGGAMNVRAGQTFQYQVLGDLPLPPVELHLMGVVTALPGASGRIRLEGPAGKALPALMRAGGDRVSLPGGAPPRVSVKVQVLSE